MSSAFAVEKDAANYLRLVGAFGNLSYGDDEAKGLAQSMNFRIDVSKIEGDEKTINTIKEIGKEIHLI